MPVLMRIRFQVATMGSLLIMGRMPPPIGGVTMHVSRLRKTLHERGFQFRFCDLGRDSVLQIFEKIVKSTAIHLHVSSPAVQLALAVFCVLTGKRLIITYHGRWGRYRMLGNWAVKLSTKLAHVPIVQDPYSFRLARAYHAQARQISTYVPAGKVQMLDDPSHRIIAERRGNYEATFCTNAWNTTFDKFGQEIYGILPLIECFTEFPNYQLLISDPSGKYQQLLSARRIPTTDNTLLVSHPHDFQSILMLSDAFIRNTTTDGVSLSIHEAREFGVPVLASSAVERPAFCSVFDDIMKIDLKVKLEEARMRMRMPGTLPDVVADLIALYREVNS